MSVILEFTADPGDFVLGKALQGPADMHYELEKIIPTEDAVMPFIWVTGSDFETFEKNVQTSPHIKELREMDKLEDTALYRIEWQEDHMSLLEGFTETGATVLEATGNGDWMFRLRFPNHNKLSQFANYLTDHEITINILHTYTLTEETAGEHLFDLTQEQREALVLALQRGYFATPSETSLTELAGELSITKQAASSRIRRGSEKVLHSALLPLVADSK